MTGKYLFLNLIFLLPAAVILFLSQPAVRRRIWRVMLPLLLLTLVFDNLLIAAGIVAYNQSDLLGIHLGLAPIEDFAYTIAVAVYLPTIWEMFKHENN